MIGVARIPLKAVSQCTTLHEKFTIHAPKTNTPVGIIEVKLSVIDLDIMAG